MPPSDVARVISASRKKDGFKASLMTCTSDTALTHLQRCRTLGEGLLKLCAHQSPYTGRTQRLFPSPQAASVRPRFEPTATPPSLVTSRGCYRYPNPPPHIIVNQALRIVRVISNRFNSLLVMIRPALVPVCLLSFFLLLVCTHGTC